MSRRTPEQLAQAAAEAEAWLDALDPDQTPARDADDLRAVGIAVAAVAAAEAQLRTAVGAARKQRRSWTLIGAALGVSKQAAAMRFGDRAAKKTTSTTPAKRRSVKPERLGKTPRRRVPA